MRETNLEIALNFPDPVFCPGVFSLALAHAWQLPKLLYHPFPDELGDILLCCACKFPDGVVDSVN